MLLKLQPYSKYVLDAARVIKQQLDNDPLKHKRACDLLEEVCAPNRNLMEKAFKAIYGVGIKEYQVRQRLEASKKFLESGKMTKRQIAARCYYRSPSAYSAAFKKAFNITPTEWQALYG